MSDLVRVRTIGTGWQGAPGLMTHYFHGSDPATAAEALEAAKRVRAFLVDMATYTKSPVTWDVLEQVDVINSVTGQLSGGFSVAAQAPVVGSGGSNLASPALGVIVQYFTGGIIAGRRLRGRTFWTPVNQGAFDSNGAVAPAAVTAITAAAGKLRTVITTATFQVVWHRPKNLVGGVISDVTSASVWTTAGVLTSRRD